MYNFYSISLPFIKNKPCAQEKNLLHYKCLSPNCTFFILFWLFFLESETLLDYIWRKWLEDGIFYHRSIFLESNKERFIWYQSLISPWYLLLLARKKGVKMLKCWERSGPMLFLLKLELFGTRGLFREICLQKFFLWSMNWITDC